MQEELRLLRLSLFFAALFSLLFVPIGSNADRATLDARTPQPLSDSPYVDAARPVYDVTWQMGTCEWNSYEQSWSYNYPSAWCPNGWSQVTSWTSGGASGSASCEVWRHTLCSA